MPEQNIKLQEFHFCFIWDVPLPRQRQISTPDNRQLVFGMPRCWIQGVCMSLQIRRNVFQRKEKGLQVWISGRCPRLRSPIAGSCVLAGDHSCSSYQFRRPQRWIDSYISVFPRKQVEWRHSTQHDARRREKHEHSADKWTGTKRESEIALWWQHLSSDSKKGFRPGGWQKRQVSSVDVYFNNSLRSYPHWPYHSLRHLIGFLTRYDKKKTYPGVELSDTSLLGFFSGELNSFQQHTAKKCKVLFVILSVWTACQFICVQCEQGLDPIQTGCFRVVCELIIGRPLHGWFSLTKDHCLLCDVHMSQRHDVMETWERRLGSWWSLPWSFYRAQVTTEWGKGLFLKPVLLLFHCFSTMKQMVFIWPSVLDNLSLLVAYW